MNFRALKENEIECRIAQVYADKGITLLLYKNARTDSTLLDETVGAENWQNKFYECKGNLYCSVGINTNYDLQKMEEAPDRWIWKDDCGSESYTEKEKGEASDAFKRACFKWGIGKELYTAPLIWIPSGQIKKWNEKGQPKDRFRVKYIKTEKGKIVQLVIFNETTKEDCFKWGL